MLGALDSMGHRLATLSEDVDEHLADVAGRIAAAEDDGWRPPAA